VSATIAAARSLQEEVLTDRVEHRRRDPDRVPQSRCSTSKKELGVTAEGKR
jgi:hypothetical protein